MANRFLNWLQNKPTLESALDLLICLLRDCKGDADMAVCIFAAKDSDETVFVTGGHMAKVLRRAIQCEVDDLTEDGEYTRVRRRHSRRNPGRKLVPDVELAELRKIAGLNGEKTDA